MGRRRRLPASRSAIASCAGAGGTSWAQVEGERAKDKLQRRLGKTFGNWGIPTTECIRTIRGVAPHVPLIASGGIRNGLDVAKTIALGADMAGLALPFLQAAADSEEAVRELMGFLVAEMTTALFCSGCRTLKDLRNPDVLTIV